MRQAFAELLAAKITCFCCEERFHHYEIMHDGEIPLCESCYRVNVGPDPYASEMPNSACRLIFVDESAATHGTGENQP